MKSKGNEVQTDNNEILKICACFYTELFSSTLHDHDPHPHPLKNSSEVPPMMTPEIKETLKEMKNNKAPGIDNLTRNGMILGREESVKQIKKN